MKVICSICCDFILPDKENIITKCGHLFHKICLQQWTSSQSSCPHCRQVLRIRDTFTAYINWDNNNFDDDPAALLNKIKDLECELVTKNLDLKKVNVELNQLSENFTNLSSNLVTKDLKIKELRKNVGMYKDLINNLEKRDIQYENVKKENIKLTEKIENLQNVDNLIKISSLEIDDFLSQYDNTTSNFKFITQSFIILKRDHESRIKKMNELKDLSNKAQKEVFFLKKENANQNKKYTEQIRMLENKIFYLEKKHKQQDMNNITLDLISSSDEDDSIINLNCPKRVKIHTAPISPKKEKKEIKPVLMINSKSNKTVIAKRKTEINIDSRHKHSIFNRAGRLQL